MKPEVKLVGENGNIYNLMAIARRALTKNNQADKAEEMIAKVTSSGSYEEALGILGEYVKIT